MYVSIIVCDYFYIILRYIYIYQANLACKNSYTKRLKVHFPQNTYTCPGKSA